MAGKNFLLGVSIFAVVVAGFLLGSLTFVLVSLGFIIGLALTQRRFVEGWARPDQAQMLVVTGRVLLVALVGYLIGGFRLVLFLLAAMMVLGLPRRHFVKYIPWPGLVLAFGLTLAGLMTLSLREYYQLSFDQPWLWTIFILLFGSAAGITYRALMIYTPPAFRLTGLMLVIPLVWLAASQNHTELVSRGGVSGYDYYHPQWFSPPNSLLSGHLNYQFFTDSRGSSWWSTGTGLVIESSSRGFRTYARPDATSQWDRWDQPRSELMGANSKIIEGEQRRLWVLTPISLAQLDPDKAEDNIIVLVGSDTIDTSKPSRTIQINALLTDITLDATGNLWLATAGQGILRLKGGIIDRSNWQAFTTADSGLPSNEVRLIHTDGTGTVWAGTANGLSRFDGTTWQKVEIAALETDTAILALFEDSRGQLWIGTTHGGYRWTGQYSTSFGEMSGWPEHTGAEIFLEDSKGNLWVGTAAGAFRFNGQRWVNVIPHLHITVLATGSPDDIWIGSRQGLVRYDLETGEQTLFNTTNSGLRADWIRDLFVERNDRLWVSSLDTEQITHSPWWDLGIMILFFGFLLGNTLRGYVQTPKPKTRLDVLTHVKN